MEFCPRCGMKMKVADEMRGEKAPMLKCPNCSYQKEENKKQVTVKAIEPKNKEQIFIVESKVKCPRCGNMQAYVKDNSDQPPTQRLNCTRCGMNWPK